MNRYQNNNDEISVYVCRGDVCNRVSLDGRGRGRGLGRVKENYGAPTDITLDSIATRFGTSRSWLLKEMATISSTQKLTINAGEILNIFSDGMLINEGVIVNNGTIISVGFFVNNGLITNNSTLDILDLQFTKGRIMNSGVINCKNNGSVFISGVMSQVDLFNQGKIIINSGCSFSLENVTLDNQNTITNDGVIRIGEENSNGVVDINNVGEILNNSIIEFLATEGINIFENNIINGSNGFCTLLGSRSDCNINHVVPDY